MEMRRKVRMFVERVRCFTANIAMLTRATWPEKAILKQLRAKQEYHGKRIIDLQYDLDGLKQLEDRLAALQALDISFRAMGKVVILSRVGKRDVCKILDIKPQTTWKEIKALTEMVKAVYGADVDRIDSPNAMSVDEFLDMGRRR